MQRNKLRVSINKMKTTAKIQRVSAMKNWFSEKISKIYKPLAKLTKEWRKRYNL